MHAHAQLRAAAWRGGPRVHKSSTDGTNQMRPEVSRRGQERALDELRCQIAMASNSCAFQSGRIPSSSFITKGPSRVLIHEALSNETLLLRNIKEIIQFPKEIDWFTEACKMVRLMGMVTLVERLSSSNHPLDILGISNQVDDMIAIEIDDGTASMRVYIHQKEIDEEQRDTILHPSKAGSIVDCLGYLIDCYPYNNTHTMHSEEVCQIYSDTACKFPRASVCLFARSVAWTNDVNVEQLRNLEILQEQKNKEKQLVTNIFYDNIFMAGSPTLTTGTFSAVASSSSSSSSYSIVVNPVHIMQLIQSASVGGGVTELDLALVLGIIDKPFYESSKKPNIRIKTTTKIDLGLEGLRHTLEELHASGMIYVGSGNVYLPL